MDLCILNRLAIPTHLRSYITDDATHHMHHPSDMLIEFRDDIWLLEAGAEDEPELAWWVRTCHEK